MKEKSASGIYMLPGNLGAALRRKHHFAYWEVGQAGAPNMMRAPGGAGKLPEGMPVLEQRESLQRVRMFP